MSPNRSQTSVFSSTSKCLFFHLREKKSTSHCQVWANPSFPSNQRPVSPRYKSVQQKNSASTSSMHFLSPASFLKGWIVRVFAELRSRFHFLFFSWSNAAEPWRILSASFSPALSASRRLRLFVNANTCRTCFYSPGAMQLRPEGYWVLLSAQLFQPAVFWDFSLCTELVQVHDTAHASTLLVEQCSLTLKNTECWVLKWATHSHNL